MSRAFWRVGAFEPRSRISGDRNDRETEEDREIKRYRVPHRCASRVAALLIIVGDTRPSTQGALPPEASELFKAFQQTDFLPVCVEHQLLRYIIGRIVTQLMPALDQHWSMYKRFRSNAVR